MRQDEVDAGATVGALGEVPVNAELARAASGLSMPAFRKAVAAGRLPAPFYPAPRAPRWYLSEIRAALAATRALPAEAKAARRAAKLAAPR